MTSVKWERSRMDQREWVQTQMEVRVRAAVAAGMMGVQCSSLVIG